MLTKNIASTLLALTIASTAGVALAANAANTNKETDAQITKECTKEFGKDHAKVDKCIKDKKASATTPAAPK